MKAYIGNKTVCLAEFAPEDEHGQFGYNVLYPDGVETWLTTEIFEFEFKLLGETETQMIMSTIVNTDLTEEQLKSIVDWDDLSIEDQDALTLDMEENPNNYEIVEDEIPMEVVRKVGEMIEEEVENAK